jgi:uroporphyrinogen decarboxylase
MITPSLTPRERIFRSLAFQESDLVPYHLMIDEQVRPRLADYYQDAGFERQINNHLPFYNLEPAIQWVSPDTYVDNFGCLWRAGASPHLERPLLAEPSLKGYQFPDLASTETFAGVEDFFARYNQHFTLCGIAHGFYDRGWALRGMEDFMVDFITQPAFVEKLFESLTQMYTDLIDRIAMYPFDGIRFGDDWGYQRGVITGANRWRKFIKPGIKRIFAHACAKGLAVMVHSDGDVTELLPDLIEMGVQIINPLQPEAMDIVAVKRRFGRDLCLNGGVSTQLTLPRGSAEEVRREVEACLRLLGKDGGYVFSPAKAILADVPLENAAALIEAMLHQTGTNNTGRAQSDAESAQTLRRVYAEFHP